MRKEEDNMLTINDIRIKHIQAELAQAYKDRERLIEEREQVFLPLSEDESLIEMGMVFVNQIIETLETELALLKEGDNQWL